MAGGPNAAAAMCLACGEKADRIAEGMENDQYRCATCGGGFSIDWSRGEPDEPAWPQTAAGLAEARRIFALIQAQRTARGP